MEIYVKMVRYVGIEPTTRGFRINNNMCIITKKCPRCQHNHTNNGAYCSRSCANSRGVRTDEFKLSVSKKLKGKILKPKFTKITFSKITGRILSPIIEDRVFWDKPYTSRFFLKVCKWCNISTGHYNTENQLAMLQLKIYDLYFKQGMSSSEIKEYLNIPLPNGHMPAFLKQMGVSRRSVSDAVSLHILKYGMPVQKVIDI